LKKRNNAAINKKLQSRILAYLFSKTFFKVPEIPSSAGHSYRLAYCTEQMSK
jgi:hypothetical protein